MLYLLNCITETILVTEGRILARPDLHLSYKILYNTENRKKVCNFRRNLSGYLPDDGRM
jgi:hypothetical protein